MANNIKLFSRQKILLGLLQVFGGNLKPLDLQKYLFLYTQVCEHKLPRSYDFVPYKYGCFSFQSYADRRKFVALDVLQDVEGWHLSNNSMDYLQLLPKDTAEKIVLFYDEYASLKGDTLIKEVYVNYPYYAINSKISHQILTPSELVFVNAERPIQKEYAFFTIGYEKGSFEEYLNKLICNNVRVLCDVRKNPISRKYGFSKFILSDTLKKLDIEYIHMPQLGIVSDKRKQLKTQKDYDRLFYEYEKTVLRENQQTLNSLYEIFLNNKRIAITCFEKEHYMCHRSKVAKAIKNRSDFNIQVQHI